MNKKYFAFTFALGMGLAPIVSAPVFAEETGEPIQPKDVYIDNTVDESVSYVTGTVTVINSDTGEQTSEMVYEQSFPVTYSNPKTEQVQGAVNDAYTAAYQEAKMYSEDVNMNVEEKTGKVWDNRKYETVEDGDAVLIGDTDYLTGAYGVDGYTRTHIASGGYGKETFYYITASVTKAAAPQSEPPQEPAVIEEPVTVEQPVQEVVQQTVQSTPAVQPQVQYAKGVNTGIFTDISLWMSTALGSLAGIVTLLRRK